MAYSLSSAIDTGKSLDYTSEVTTPSEVLISMDGSKLYISDNTDSTIHQYTLSTPWDISTASYASKSYTVAEDNTLSSFFIKPDGTKLYVMGISSDDMYQYTLATPWDISTASYDSVSIPIPEEATVQCITISPDGLHLYLGGLSTNALYQYDFTTAWDLSSASYASKSITGLVSGSPRGVAISYNGRTLIIGTGNNDFFEIYNLSTPWDLSTASLTVSPRLGAVGQLTSFSFGDYGRSLYVRSVQNSTIIQYDTQSLYERSKRSIAQSLSISWKKAFDPLITFFTIGVSSIGGNDLIAPSEIVDSQWNKYEYFDESDYVMGLEYERGLNMPLGGIKQGLAQGILDNTTGRFTPYYMGGDSELFTSILPRRPFILNAGFEDGGLEFTEPQFVGLFTKQPEIDFRSKTLGFQGADFLSFIQNRYVDNTIMYTSQRSDQLIETLLTDLGYATAQYELDTGINIIPFAIFNKGDRLSDIISRIAQAENAHFYQDPEGKLRFENRQHWDSSPHTEVQYEIFTSQVIDAKAPDDEHIINVVEISSKIIKKQPEQIIFRLAPFDFIEVPGNDTVEFFVDFENPALSMTAPTEGGNNSYFIANSESDGSGTDKTSNISIAGTDVFAEAAKFQFSNSSSTTTYITTLVISGRAAVEERELYLRDRNDSSVTAYEERLYSINNPYIHEESWAESLAQIILEDYSQPENLQEITILAIPSLRLGDLIGWQGRNWRVFNIRTRLDPGNGFIQELSLLQRTVTSYFRIGISTIGSADKIAP